MGTVSTFRDTTAITAREAEVVAANFANGMNNGLCSPGIGINIGEGAVVGTPEQFTLEDQFEAIRVPQVSQALGGLGYTDYDDYPSSGGIEGNGSAHAEFIVPVGMPTQAAKDADSSLDGTVTVLGTANLQTLAAGWVGTAV
jgi:hypothetical protein